MIHPYTDIIKRIEDSTIPSRAVELLRSSNPTSQKAAVEILVEKPSADALDRLWELRRSLEDNDDDHFFFRLQVDQALASCVKLSPEWLQRVIQRSDPDIEPFGALVYLLVQIAEVENGGVIWRSVRKTVLEKTPSAERRALSYVIESFGDMEAMSRLPNWVDEDKDLVAPAALRALELLNPEEALMALERASLESSLLLARSWWLPQLLAFNYERTSEILRQKIERHEKPWFAAAVYDGRENMVTCEILDLLLEETGKLLETALAQPESEKDPLHRPFSFLAEISRRELLARFKARRGTRFEVALTQYMISQGPNDEGWHRWKVEYGISMLRKIGGNGFTRLANYHLKAAVTRLGIRDGLLLGIQRPDDDTVRLMKEIAFDPERELTENGFSLVQYESLKALAALGQWRDLVQGSLRLGLRIPKTLPYYFEKHTFDAEELADALVELRSGAPSPGALLMVGFSGRLAFAPEVRAIYNESEMDSERSLACLLALESLRDMESENIFLANLDSPKNGWVATRALLGAVRTARGDEALLDRLSHFSQVEGGSRGMLAMNLLIREETRLQAARLLWAHVSHSELLFYTGDTLEYLAVLDIPEVEEFLRNAALSDQRGAWHGANRHSAILGLSRFDGRAALEAAKALLASDDGGRLFCPETMLKIDKEEALNYFHQILVDSEDFLVMAAIGEALDRHSLMGTIKVWLADQDHRIRQACCFIIESWRWSQELESLVLSRLRDPNWNVRVAARAAWESLVQARETERLAQAVSSEKEHSYRWALVDAALTIGYPGVVAGYGADSWFGSMCEGQPYALRNYAISRLNEKRKKLRDQLAKRERD